MFVFWLFPTSGSTTRPPPLPSEIAGKSDFPTTLKYLLQQKSKDVSVFRFGAKSPKTRIDENKDKEKEVNATYFKCETCEYKCKKKSTLLKHIQLKHSEQKCKICGKEFKESMS